MEPETQYEFADEEQFWHALDELLVQERNTHSLIDDALRSYLTLTTSFPEYIQSDHDLRQCAFQLYSSRLFEQNADYIRLQFLHCLLQEDDASILHTTTTFLLADARENEQIFELLNERGIFPRLVALVGSPKHDGEEGLHRTFMELLYEMARIQRITNDDLTCVDDDFVCHMFEIIEQVSGNVDDPYHYPVIRVLLVLNEQFMVAAHDPVAVSHGAMPLTNKVMKVLSSRGGKYKTFGENIILLLNREDETSLQLLTLKLLYLLFTTPPTYEYFYTNDLHVLVDILIRNSLDLPADAMSLRHTYLRVLFPLLEYTQLKDPPHYKRDEIRKLLTVLVGGQHLLEEGIGHGVSYFEEVDETTKRLVNRCQTVTWLKENVVAVEQPSSPVETLDSPIKSGPPALPAPRKLRKRNPSKDSSSGPYIMPRLESARESSLSMVEMATQKEKPGVITPSRNPTAKQGIMEAIMRKKEKPPPPKARRTGWPRIKEQKFAAEPELPTADPTKDSSHDEPQLSVSTPAAAQERASRCFKKPPPAPKQRGWRSKCSQDNSKDEYPHDENPFLEPEVFSMTPPTINIVIPDEPPTLVATISATVVERSPFSPPEEKTLSEQSPFSPSAAIGHSTSSLDDLILQFNGSSAASPDTKKTNRISSVSAALTQAQAQAVHDLAQTLEKVTIHEETKQEEEEAAAAANAASTKSTTVTTAEPQQPHAITTIISSQQHQQHQQHRPILAPPSQPPLRGVPGPKVELERSPFLSDDDVDDDDDDEQGETEVDHRDRPRKQSRILSLGEEGNDLNTDEGQDGREDKKKKYKEDDSSEDE